MANCSSHPSGVRVSGVAITPALFTSTCSGPLHPFTNASMDARSVSSSGATRTGGPPAVDAIAAVPADPGRLLERGHHPPGRLAAALAARWELPLVEVLERTRSVPRQTSLPGAERRRNLSGVFRPTGSVPGRLLLVDDVYTTGSTANAAASALRRGGAGAVDVITFARAIR